MRKAAVWDLRSSESADVVFYLVRQIKDINDNKDNYVISSLGDLMDEDASSPLEAFFKLMENPLKKIGRRNFNKI